jgi:hyperosmotically inducible protein
LVACLAAAGAAMSTGLAVAADDAVPRAKSDSIGAAVGDTAITGKVKARLIGEPVLKQSDISVTTTNGVVTLDGSASSGEAKSFAETATLAVDGVRSVDNQLKTPSASAASAKAKKAAAKTGQVVSDSWITTKVKSEILVGSVSEGFDVSVETINGVVVLKGHLPDQLALDHVRKATQQVKGVKSVDSSAVSVGASIAGK